MDLHAGHHLGSLWVASLALLALAAVQPGHAQAPGTLKWIFKADGRVDSSPALGLDGSILFKASDGQVYALTSGGGLKWKRLVGSGSIATHSSSPAVGADGTVFVGGGTDAGGAGYFHALNPADGSDKWASLGGSALVTGGPITTRHTDTFHSPALGQDGKVYVSSKAGRVYVFGPDGSLLREMSSSNNSPRIPAVDSLGIPYYCQSSVPEGNGSFGLSRFRPDGTAARLVTISTNRTDPCEGTRVSIGPDGTLYVVSRVTSLWAFTPDAKLKWKTPFDISQAPAVGADGTLYALSGVSTYGNGMTRLNAISPAGTLLWAVDLASADWPGQYTPAIDNNGVVYAGSSLWLFAIRPDGTLKWRFQTSSPITTSPLIDNAGTVYVGTFDGNLYAVNGDSTGLASSSWPMFNADARHTGQGRASVPLAYANPADCLFNWAEQSYASLFSPALGESYGFSPPFYYRSYGETGALLGTSSLDQHVYYLGPWSNGTVLGLGALAPWLGLAGCSTTPAQ